MYSCRSVISLDKEIIDTKSIEYIIEYMNKIDGEERVLRLEKIKMKELKTSNNANYNNFSEIIKMIKIDKMIKKTEIKFGINLYKWNCETKYMLREKFTNNDHWEFEFVNKIAKNRRVFYNLMYTLNYLDIPELLNICCAKIITQIEGLPIERIRDILLN